MPASLSILFSSFEKGLTQTGKRNKTIRSHLCLSQSQILCCVSQCVQVEQRGIVKGQRAMSTHPLIPSAQLTLAFVHGFLLELFPSFLVFLQSSARKNFNFYLHIPGLSDLGSTRVRLAQNGTNPCLFRIRFQYILALQS